MKKTTTALLTVALLGVPAAQAQGGPSPKGLATLPMPGGAMLRWLPSGVPDSYKLTREGGGTTVTRTLPGMASQAEAVKQGWVSASEYDELKKAYSTLPTQNTPRTLLLLQLMTQPDWARTLNTLISDTGLKDGVKYTYRLAEVRGGQEKLVGTATVTPGPTPPVPVPTGLVGVPDLRKVALSWANPGGLVMAYNIYRAEGSGQAQKLPSSPYFPTQAQANTPAKRQAFTDTATIKRQTKYTYTLSSVDLFGRESARSQPVTVDTGEAELFPQVFIQKVTTKEDQPGKVSVHLFWNRVSDPRLQGLILYRGQSRDTLKPYQELPVTATSFSDQDVQPAQMYYYSLGLKLGTGPSGPGIVASAQPLSAVKPAAPANLTGTFQNNQVTLKWQPLPGKVMGYVVVRGATPTTAPDQRATVTPQHIGATTLTFPLTVAPGTGMTFWVMALSPSGVLGQPSQPVTLTAPRQNADAPHLDSVTAGAQGIALGWSYQGSPPAQVEIFRKNPDQSLALIGRVPGSQRTFLDENVLPTYAYAYLVAGISSKGERSQGSNVQAATATYQPNIGDLSGLSGQGQGAQMVLTWAATRDAALYIVERVRAGRSLELTRTTARTFTAPAHQPGDKYRVTPVDLTGGRGRAAEYTAP